jgi:hypothetical protein
MLFYVVFPDKTKSPPFLRYTTALIMATVTSPKVGQVKIMWMTNDKGSKK